MKLFRKLLPCLTPYLTLCLALITATATFADKLDVSSPQNPQAILTTDLGVVTLELLADKAPLSVANFLQYAQSGFYNGVIFHRVIPGFVAQTGGYTFDFVKKPTSDPIKNESRNGLRNLRGTVAMARLTHPDSATSQFFINLTNNTDLDAAKKKPGYTVFARVIAGMDVIDKIAKEPRGQYREFREAPNVSVRILSVAIKKSQ